MLFENDAKSIDIKTVVVQTVDHYLGAWSLLAQMASLEA